MINIRAHRVEDGIIAIWHQNGSIPVGYTELTSFQCKYIRGAPCGCNPDACVGCATHTHASFAAHTHTLCPTTHCHSHSIGTGSPSATSQGTASGACLSGATHTHSFGSTCTNATLSTCNNSTHAHAAVNNDLAHITTRFIQKTSNIIEMRKKTVPFNVSLIWDDNLANIPVEYSKETALLDKHIKGNACIGTTAGCNAHAEVSQAAHTHPVSIASHGHTVSTPSSCVGNTITSTGSGGPCNGVSSAHNHSSGSGFITSGASCGTSSCGGSHTHPSIDNQPAFREVMYITKRIIPFRKLGVSIGVISMWKDVLGCIPVDYTNLTTFFARHPKAVLTACTATGTNSGSDTHQHASDGGHTHTSTVTHTHSSGGTTGVAGTPVARNSGLGGGRHSHGLSGGTSASNPTPTLNCGGAHQHTAISNIPASKTVAFIKRL